MNAFTYAFALYIIVALWYLQKKAKEKVKEKLEKCTKEKLWEFCDVLDIHITKATTKKVIMVINF